MTNPDLMVQPFAINGQKNPIYPTRQEGQAPQDATLNDGFPPLTMIPKESGGIAPNGPDMNGILNLISQDTVHRQKGGRIQFSFAYATAIGGYPIGAIIQSDDTTKEYRSLIDGNLTNPNSSNTSQFWEVYSGAGSIPSATSQVAGIAKLVNNLTSTATDAALTAAQGKVLAGKIDNIPAQLIKNICRVRNLSSSPAFDKNSGFSSVVRLGVGVYEFTLSSLMPDANYLVMLSGAYGFNGASSINLANNFTQTRNKFRVVCHYGGDNTQGPFDPLFINAVVIG